MLETVSRNSDGKLWDKRFSLFFTTELNFLSFKICKKKIKPCRYSVQKIYSPKNGVIVNERLVVNLIPSGNLIIGELFLSLDLSFFSDSCAIFNLLDNSITINCKNGTHSLLCFSVSFLRYSFVQ